jgi:hypothetical protein
MVGRGKDDVIIRDPAFAAAAGKCWLSRMMGGRVGSAVADHPLECSFCKFDLDYLCDRIEEFLHWAGMERIDEHRPGEPTVYPVRTEIESFMMQTKTEQERLVRKAQGQIAVLQEDDDVERPSDVWR